MPGIEKEGIVFVEALLAGMIVLTSYTCIRKFRRVVKHNLFAVAVEDLVFWIGTAFYLFVQIYHTSDGGIRWYFVLGVVVGATVMLLLGKIEKNIHKKMYTKKHGNSGKSIAKKKKKR